MTNCQSPVSSSLVILNEGEQQPRKQWSRYQLNSYVVKLSLTNCSTIQAIKQVWVYSCSSLFLVVQLVPNQKAS